MTTLRLPLLHSISSIAATIVSVYFAIQGNAFAQNTLSTNAPPSQERLEEAKRYIEMASTPAKVTAYVSNYTRMTYDRAHGTQIEYNTPDGHSYLWYPGSRFVTPGRWKVDEAVVPGQTHRYVTLCYLYSASSYDPTNNSRGGKWECVPAVLAMIRTKERSPGNPFRLGLSPQTPFILSPGAADLATLLRQVRH